MIYFAIIFFLVVFSLLEINIKKEVEYLVIYILIAVFLIMMAGLRYKTGYDYENYERIFYDATLNNYQSFLIEYGSALLIVLTKLLGWNFTAYLLIYALISIYLKFFFFAKYSPYLFPALLIYFSIGFLINEFGQIRHGLAVGIVLVAFTQLFESRPKLFFFFSTVAIFFHLSAFIVLPVYFLINRQYKSSTLLVSVFLLSFFLFIDSRPFFLSILSSIPINAMQAKMTFYLYSEQFGQPLGLNMSIVLRVLIFFGLLYYRQTGEARFYFYKKFVWLYYYGIVLYLVFNSIADFAIRSSLYFKTLDCIILPCIISFGKTKKDKGLILLLVIVYSLYSVYKLLADPVAGGDFIPYRTIFNKT